MTDENAEPSKEENPKGEMHIMYSLPPEQEVGVFADFANIWRTQNSFIIDFATVIQPVQEGTGENNKPMRIVNARVSRIRIPPEQIFPLIKALQAQGDEWLAENGRDAPPDNFWENDNGVSH
jgi:hypothetical protein